MEYHHMMFRHHNLIDPVQENIFIEVIQSQDCYTLPYEDCLRDASFRATAPACQFMRTTIPEFLKAPVLAEIVHETPPAYAAFDFSREAGRVQGLIGKRSQFLTPCHFPLHIVEDCLVDNGFVVIFDIVLGQFPVILFPLFSYRVFDVFLLQEQVSRVCDVCQDNFDIGVLPSTATPGGDALGSKFPFRFQSRLTIKEILENAFYNSGFFRDDDKMVAFPSITINLEPSVRYALLEPFPCSPFDVLADGAALFLRKGREDGQHQFPVACQ